ncbi:hypothetical protein BJX68DRAFT_19280 [Aspergillus pseudodeflectus]|uniref:Uncharacterized protein n=1 Tax=Aspergillus pseudodeflectus TaxID=176178 RepID=A0ABR4LC97_9EURO
MLQPRGMLLRPRRVGWMEPSLPSIRQFSLSKTLRDDPAPPSNSASPPAKPTQPKKLKIPPALLKFKNSNTDKAGPRRFVDARQLAASRRPGQLPNVLKGPPRFQGRKPGSAGPRTPSRDRKPGTQRSAQRGNQKRPFRRRLDDGAGDTALENELEDVYRELAEKDKPTPTRYQPQPPSLQNLSETWPSFPTDVTATTAGIVEKLSSLGGRIADGYVPPYILGKRLSDGEYVRFLSEEEKTQAFEAAKKYRQEDADKLSQKKGELVDPRPVELESVKAEDHQLLIQSLGLGKYPSLETKNDSPLVGEILRNLQNNETYNAAGKQSQFMAKVESLLVQPRPAKRA